MTSRKTTKGPRRVVGYVRVSKAREEQTSTRTQRAAIERYCADRGWILVDVCEDEGRSAFKSKTRKTETRRPGLDRALDLIGADVADTLMVWKLDRFVRSVQDFGHRWNLLERAGAEFVSVTDNFDTTTAMGRAMLLIAVVFAQLESDIKSERIEEWQQDRRTRGATPTGPRPYGYRRERNRLVIDAEEAAAIKEAAAALLAGESLRAIVRRLNAGGHVAKNGKPLNRRGLAAVLSSPTIAACREVDGTFVPSDTWEEILDRETWEEVRSTLADPSRRVGPGNGRRWLLTGIATCERDGGALFVKPSLTGPRYTCPTCGMSITALQTDEVITRDLLALLDESTWRKLRAMSGRPAEVDSTGYDEAMRTLIERFNAGEFDALELATYAEGLKRQRDAAIADPVRLPDVADVRAAWTTPPEKGGLSIDQRRIVLTAATESLTIKPGRPGANRYDELRVDFATAV